MAPGEQPTSPLAEQEQVIASIRSEISRMRSGLGRIERDLSVLELGPRSAAASLRERPERYLRVLVDVYDRGGRHGLDADTFAAVGAAHEYDRRGLGGFFTGRMAPLRRDHGRVALTPYGEQLVDLYLQRLNR